MTHIVLGVNTFLVRAAQQKIIAEFVRQHGDLALERLDGEDLTLAQLQGALHSLPFLATKKMVVLSGASTNKEIVEHIADILGDMPESTDLLIIEGKLDKRGVYYKTLKKQKGVTEFDELDDAALARWLVEYATENGATLSFADAKHLVDRAGPNQQLLSGELEKLALFNEKVSAQTIDLLVEPHPQSTVFELLDAAFSGNIEKTLRLYEEQRTLKVEPQAMLAMIAWQLHILALIKVAGKERTPSDIAREAHVSPYVVNKSITAAKHLSTKEIKDLVHETLTLDVRLKSEPVDADSALQNLLISIATKES